MLLKDVGNRIQMLRKERTELRQKEFALSVGIDRALQGRHQGSCPCHRHD